jgi:hypothetical protein
MNSPQGNLIELAPSVSRVRLIIGFVVAILVWYFACLMGVHANDRFLSPMNLVQYEDDYGNVQLSFLKFVRIATYLGYFTMTLPATVLSLWTFNRIGRLRAGWRDVFLIGGTWELLVVIVSIAAYELEWAYRLNKLVWRLFGPSDDLYSFQNLLLPRLVIWVSCTIPICICALRAIHRRAMHSPATHQTD